MKLKRMKERNLAMDTIFCYRIIRFRMNGKPRTIKKGLSLEEAQKHCSREDTKGQGWFDGYELMKGVKLCAK